MTDAAKIAEVITEAEVEAASEEAWRLANVIVMGRHGVGNTAVLIDRALRTRDADLEKIRAERLHFAALAEARYHAGREATIRAEAADAKNKLLTATIAEQAARIEALEAEVERKGKQVVELAVAKQRLERAVIKTAAPDFMTAAEQEALADFVRALRATNKANQP